MRDRPIIYSGLFIFLLLFTFPVWRDLAARATTKGPQQVVPSRNKQCVAPVEYMKTSHMKLLLDWRDRAVRMNDRRFSLTACLKCHGTKADFCERCHTYAAVSATCWDCHLDVGRTSVRAGLQPRSAGGAQ